jgi:1,4-alpha-glucan branching enzyme
MNTAPRKFVLVLHSHLPYVLSHGKWPHGTDWLSECAAETYLPLLEAFDGMVGEGISPKATVGITPVLAEQLAAPGFGDELDGYLAQKRDAAIADGKQFQKTGEKERAVLANYWTETYSDLLTSYNERYGRDIIGGFRKLQDNGHIEIITCAATHGYLPLLGTDENVRAQIRQGVEVYQRHFGRSPKGIWIPECAYRPPYEWSPPIGEEFGPKERRGVDSILSEHGIDYFILDTHLLRGGEPIGAYLDRFGALKSLWQQFEEAYPSKSVQSAKTPLAPYYAGGIVEGQKPVAFFARHPECSLQVWSGEYGYPGDGSYLDFHKKNFPGGHRYWRVTGSGVDLGDKMPYDLSVIEGRLEENAAHFVDLVGEQMDRAGEGEPVVLTAPFDTELFGHWWFEGVRWIRKVLTKMAEREDYSVATGSEALQTVPPREMLSVPEGSWGEGGFHYIWLNDETEWTWSHIYKNEKAFADLVRRAKGNHDIDLRRVMRQLAREVLLLESSDWQFLISTQSARDYAEMRFAHHGDVVKRLLKLSDILLSGKKIEDGDWLFVEECETRDNLFPEIDPDWWLPVETG